MFKLFLAVVVTAMVTLPVLGSSKIVYDKDGTPTYVPDITVKKVPPEQILITPKPEDVDSGQIGVGCDTLRGKGLGVIILNDQIIQFVIDCPIQPRRDT